MTYSKQCEIFLDVYFLSRFEIDESIDKSIDEKLFDDLYPKLFFPVRSSINESIRGLIYIKLISYGFAS